MSAPYIPDPSDYFAQHDREMQNKLELLPICDECGQHIQDEFYYEDEYGIYDWDCWEAHVAKTYRKINEI